MQRLPAMQRIERLQNGGDLTAHEALVLRTLLREPRTEIAMLGVFHREAVPHAIALHGREPIEDLQRAPFASEQLGEVRLAKPARDAIADLDAHLRGQSAARRRRREIDLAEPALSDQPLELIGLAALGAV